MRNAGWDSYSEIAIILVIGLLIVVGIGLAMCKVMGWDRKVMGNYLVIVVGVGASFMLAAHLLSQFF